jgi:hypothetical protein
VDTGVGRAPGARRLRRGLMAAVVLGVAAAGLVRAQQPAPASSPSDAASPAVPVVQPPAAPDAASPAALPGLRPATDASTPDVADSAARPRTATATTAAPEKPPEPPKPLRSPAAILQALDKVTAETIRFEAPIGKRIRYKNLIFTVKACETTGIDDPQPQAAAYLVVDSQPPPVTGHRPPPAKQVYKGWMFSTAPGLHPFEHPVYDAWLIACSASVPPA